jgi:dTDP-4-amino-4,6-dideoxy-D-galactose acyltransferase
MYKLEAAAWDEAVPDPVEKLAEAARRFLSGVDTLDGRYYVWAELPAEDSVPIQALGMSGFRLTETRLIYYLPDPALMQWPERYPVRLADEGDIDHLRRVAVTARNPYDRYHIDAFFGPDVADRYLATYAEESVRGLADFVVIPDPPDGALPGGFFTATSSVPPACPLGGPLPCQLDLGVGRIPLVAVSPERSGWHLRLLVETTRLLAERSADVVHMSTQATNHAVRRNCEKVGYRLGRVTHVLVASSGKA